MADIHRVSDALCRRCRRPTAAEAKPGTMMLILRLEENERGQLSLTSAGRQDTYYCPRGHRQNEYDDCVIDAHLVAAVQEALDRWQRATPLDAEDAEDAEDFSIPHGGV